MTTQKLNQLFKQYLTLKTEYDTIKRELEGVKDELIACIGADSSVETNKYIASVKTVESSRFDSGKYKEEHPKIYQQYMVGYTYPKLNVKAV